MKFWNTLLCVVIIGILGMGTVFGATSEKETIELMDELTKAKGIYKMTTTLVEGKELETDVSGFIIEENGKQVVYVPISTIYRSLGASVSWQDKVKRLTVKQNGNTYIFDINKTYVTVNNQKKDIEGKSPVRLMTYAGTPRTMVPASVVTMMGMEYKYQPEIRTINISKALSKIQSMRYNAVGRYKEVRVKTSKEIGTKSYMIDGTSFGGKSKVIVEFQNTVLEAGVVTSLQGDGADVNRIDLVNPAKVPPRIRLEIELTTPKGFYSYYDKATGEQVVQILNAIKDIQIEKQNGYPVLNIKTVAKPEFVVEKLAGKLVIDFMNTKLAYNNGSASEKSIQQAGLLSVAYSQDGAAGKYKPEDLVTRTVLNFADATQQENVFVKQTEDGVQIFLQGDPDKGLRYNKLSSAASKIEFKFKEEATVTKELKNETGELVLNIPKTAVDLENIYKECQDNIVQYIDVNTTKDPNQYRITVKLLPGTVVYDNSDKQMLSVAFINETISNSANKKTLIVLDAGHGGSDPGTIGRYTLAKEKDLTLKAIYELKDELEKNGFEVALTRTNDTRVELYQRTDFANEINANLFISIHYNSTVDSKPKGIEVFYYPDSAGVKRTFAKSIYDSLISSTGAQARGAKESTLLVIPRETKMPSTLIEMGFVSNRDEEILVQKPDYLNVQIKAIVEGVKKYLESR